MATLSLPKSTEFDDGNLAVGTDVLANDQAIANFLNAQNLDQNNMSPSMTPTWTGVHKHGANLQMISGYDILMYSDTSTTLTGAWDSATGTLGIAATAKFYLDGGALTGDTYFYESAANVVRGYMGALNLVTFAAADGTAANAYWALPATSKLYLDGGSDTYIYESAANRVDIYCGGVQSIQATDTIFAFGTDVQLAPTKKLYLDGGGDTYIYESSANVMSFYAGGAERFRVDSAFGVRVISANDFSINSGSKLYLDGGGDTYSIESSANVLDTYVGGTLSHRQNSAGETLLPDVDPPTANYINRNSGVKAWGYFTSAGATDAAYNCSCSYSGAAATGYTVTWNTDFSSVNYAAVAQIRGVAGFARIQSQFAGTALVILYDTSGSPITAQFSIIAIGDQ